MRHDEGKVLRVRGVKTSLARLDLLRTLHNAYSTVAWRLFDAPRRAVAACSFKAYPKSALPAVHVSHLIRTHHAHHHFYYQSAPRPLPFFSAHGGSIPGIVPGLQHRYAERLTGRRLPATQHIKKYGVRHGHDHNTSSSAANMHLLLLSPLTTYATSTHASLNALVPNVAIACCTAAEAPIVAMPNIRRAIVWHRRTPTHHYGSLEGFFRRRSTEPHPSSQNSCIDIVLVQSPAGHASVADKSSPLQFLSRGAPDVTAAVLLLLLAIHWALLLGFKASRSLRRCCCFSSTRSTFVPCLIGGLLELDGVGLRWDTGQAGLRGSDDLGSH